MFKKSLVSLLCVMVLVCAAGFLGACKDTGAIGVDPTIALEQEIAMLETKVNDLTEDVEELEESIATKDSEIADLNTDKETLENQITELEAAVVGKDEIIVQLNARKAELDAQIVTLTGERDELQRQKIVLEEQLENLREENAALEQENNELLQDNAILQYELQKAKILGGAKIWFNGQTNLFIEFTAGADIDNWALTFTTEGKTTVDKTEWEGVWNYTTQVGFGAIAKTDVIEKGMVISHSFNPYNSFGADFSGDVQVMLMVTVDGIDYMLSEEVAVALHDSVCEVSNVTEFNNALADVNVKTIKVLAGEYDFGAAAIAVNREVGIFADGEVVFESSAIRALEIRANNVTINGITFRGDCNTYISVAHGFSNATVANNVFDDNANGLAIYFNRGTSGVVTNNTFLAVRKGVSAQTNGELIIEFNTFDGVLADAIELFFDGDEHYTVRGNGVR
jgi:hypothetical protein